MTSILFIHYISGHSQRSQKKTEFPDKLLININILAVFFDLYETQTSIFIFCLSCLVPCFPHYTDQPLPYTPGTSVNDSVILGVSVNMRTIKEFLQVCRMSWILHFINIYVDILLYIDL